MLKIGSPFKKELAILVDDVERLKPRDPTGDQPNIGDLIRRSMLRRRPAMVSPPESPATDDKADSKEIAGVRKRSKPWQPEPAKDSDSAQRVKSLPLAQVGTLKPMAKPAAAKAPPSLPARRVELGRK